MKLRLARGTMILLSCFLFWNCSSDDGGSSTPTDERGTVQVKFENQFANLSPIVLNQTTQVSSNGQAHQFSTLKYIVSNFTLISSNGNSYTYHHNNPDKGAFVIDQSDAVMHEIILNLDEIPAGTYSKIRFGLGISQSAYLLGAEGQGVFWAKAAQEGMTWAWATGYVFMKLEGKYGVGTPTINFSHHPGNMGNVTENGTPDLYREVELSFPTPMVVSAQGLPGVHILADLNQFLDGQTPMILNESNHDEMGSSQTMVNLTNNLSKMFSVSHIHNN